MVGGQFRSIDVDVIVDKNRFLLLSGFYGGFQFRHVILVGADGFPERVLVKINYIHSFQGIDNPDIVEIVM